jgi:hypothetical protein
LEDKRPIKRKQKSNSFIFLLFGGFLLIMIVSLAALLPKSPDENSSYDNGQKTTEDTRTENEKEVTAIITGRDDMMPGFYLRDINDGQDFSLTLTEGSVIMDKYGKNVMADSLKIGDLAEISYDGDSNSIVELKLWDKAWRYEGIQNWSAGPGEGSFTIADRLYQYPDYLFVTSEGKKLTLNDLDKSDELMAIGYEKTIYSILVTKGHGTLRFKDYGDFLGGTVYIGKREVLPIIEDMTVTIREGDYDITMEKDGFTGTKSVSVLPGKETEVNMGEFKKPAPQTGKVTFHISPLGAQLYVDDLLVSYDIPIDIEYGDHSIKATLGGYKEYTGTLKVKEEEKDIFIKLVETDNTKEESSAQENSQTGSGKDGTNNSGTNSNSNNNNTGSNSNSTGNGSSDNSTDNGSNTSQTSSKNYIYIQSPDGASVYVNGEFKGIAPVSFPKTTTGQLYITFIQSGYDTKTYTVEVKNDGEDDKLNFPALEASD